MKQIDQLDVYSRAAYLIQTKCITHKETIFGFPLTHRQQIVLVLDIVLQLIWILS